MDLHVSQADVLQAKVARDWIKLAWDEERRRLAWARKERLKASLYTRTCRSILRIRQGCDRTITRPGGFVNVLILGGAVFVIGAVSRGFTGYHVILTALAGSL